MEMKNGIASGRGMKAQMFSLTALIFVLLMVVALLLFVVMGIGYDSVSESSILSGSTTNYGSLLSSSADSFAYTSASTALSTLFTYEYNSSLRGTNFISNLSAFMVPLMENGTIPNVTGGSIDGNYISSLMGNATFAAYNSGISSVTGMSSKQVSITQTKPVISQESPYSITIRYTENVLINTSTGVYHFNIPVNVSMPLNGTPDLFYAQQGVYRQMRFSSLQGLVKVIGNEYATTGNSSGFVYGTVIQIPSGATSCSAVPSSLSVAPYDKFVILATANAFGITGGASTCASQFGGLVAQLIDTPPSTPYLLYPSGSDILNYLTTGRQVLLYGPGLSVLNVSGLDSAAAAGDYFTSPFTPSYLQRVTGNFRTGSPNGIFTLFPYSRQVLALNGSAPASAVTLGEQQKGITSYTVAAWVYPASQSGLIESDRGSGAGHSLTLGFGGSLGCLAPQGSFFFGDSSDGVGLGVESSAQYPSNTWYYVVGTFSGKSGTAVSPSQFKLYINGNEVQTNSWCSAGADTAPLTGLGGISIGSGSPSVTESGSISGYVANLQIYNSTLSAAQIANLYQQGVEGLPISSAKLQGWYTLNGNPNDYSGNQYSNSTSVNTSYVTIPDYTRDAAYVQQYPSNTYAIPGLLSCNNNAQCGAPGKPQVYLSDAPLELGNYGITAPYFDGLTSNVMLPSAARLSPPSFAVSFWVDEPVAQSYWTSIVDKGRAESNVLLEDWYFLTPNTKCGNGQGIDFGAGISGASFKELCYNWGNPGWHYVVGEFSNTLLTEYLYIDGTEVNSTLLTSRFSEESYPIMLGARSPSSTNTQAYFLGYISNLQVYNTTLTGSQIMGMYRAGITAPPLYNTSNLAGWWPLSGNLNDYSGYRDNGQANSLSYAFIQANYSTASYNYTGLSTAGAVSREWQSLGFPAPP